MTYDKVQFAMNRHQNSVHKDVDGSPNSLSKPALEGEKLKIIPNRSKRPSNAHESNLPDIIEVEDTRKSVTELADISENEHCVNKSETGWKSTTFDSSIENEIVKGETNVNEKVDLNAMKSEVKNRHTIGKECKIVTRKSSHEFEKECKSLSQRDTNGKEIEKSNNTELTNSHANKQIARRNSKHSLPSNQEKDITVPALDILNIGKEYKSRKIGEMSDDCSHVHSGTINSHTGEGELLKQLPKLKCNHINNARTQSREEQLRKTLKWKTGKERDPEKCVICEITDATAKYASVESSRLLLEIVYPHEFYDRYSRSGRKVNTHPGSSKDSITICKPVKVARKFKRDLNQGLTERTAPPNTVREETITGLDSERTEASMLSPEKRRKKDEENVFKKEIHLQCRPKSNALVITDSAKGQKIVLKGLKGWILKKDDACKNKIHKEIKQSLYQVNSLGMQFSIPEYNTSLHDRNRNHQPPRPVTTSLNSPLSQSLDSSRRQYLHGISGRQHTFVTAPSREIDQASTSVMGLQRAMTNIPKLVSQSIRHESYKTLTRNRNASSSAYSSEHKSEKALSTASTEKLSLPPIGGPDIKTSL